ncbi:hypothetical protein [Sebaldella termitidis]|nr:hypothetical protein [Sebaldella termitidis]
MSFIKNIGFTVEDEFHKKLKIKATKEGKGIKEYIIDLIKKDMEKDSDK